MSRIGIIGAMDLEVETLISEMSIEKSETRAQMTFNEGKLGDADVVVVKSGIGKINAAVCAQILVDDFKVTHLINTGVAGSLNSVLDIGDILISDDAVHHDMDVSPLGYEPGQVPGMDVFSFKADDRLAALAQETIGEVLPELKSLRGRVVSGDQFIAGAAIKERLVSVFHGDCAEMEGASIAHVAYLNSVPFVILRAISDKADGSASLDYPTFEHAAAIHSATLVTALVQKI